MANAEHLAILQQGVEAWNKWTRENDKIPDLIGADLNEVNLNGADLSKAGLYGANLSGANLIRADLSKADLSKADLIRADLSSANLSGANLSEAKLIKADLSGADLSGADLSKALVGWTVCGNVDLSQAKWLDTVNHIGPSTIGIDTIFLSKGKISEVFLRGAGVPDNFITYIGSLVGKAIEFYSCFISYSTKDQDFANRLYADLQSKGVRCWFAPHDAQRGQKLHEQIDEAIRMHEKLLLILSPQSMASNWVIAEDFPQLQDKLNARYETFRRAIEIPVGVASDISAPLFLNLKVTPEWPQSKLRVLIVGQETRGWSLSSVYHGRPSSPCQFCPYEPFSHLFDWQACARPIESLLHVYEIFNFATTQCKNFHSPFWTAFRDLRTKLQCAYPTTALTWSNLYRMDFQKVSVLKAKVEVREAIRSAQRYLLRDEIRILQPDAVVFFTGRDYDHELCAEFQGARLSRVSPLFVQQFARVTHSDLPAKSFRTYHPSYLRRSRQWCFIDKLWRQIEGRAI